jgi:superfamily I DNA and/or RNA helicase
MNTLLESHLDKTKLTITTDTVHGFQGGECDIVFVVFNPSSLSVTRSRFFQEEYKFIANVAVSRARDYLVLLIPDQRQ